MIETPVSSQIYKSRDQIREQLIVLIKQYLELENVDLTKSSFLSFIVNALSTLTSNTLFYQISTYREFFLTKAQLPESIYNLAAFLGYQPEEAVSSQVNMLFTIPFGFEDAITIFEIPEGFTVKTDSGTTFTTYYSTQIEVINNAQVKITVREGNRSYILPVTLGTSEFLFLLPFRQFSTTEQEFQIDEDLKQYQFVFIDVPFTGQISNKTISIKAPESSLYEVYTEVASLFLMDAYTKGYVSKRSDDGMTLQFGNNLIGFQPLPGSSVLVNLDLTEGHAGNVIAGSIKQGDRIYNTTDAGLTELIEYSITNPSPAFNGKDQESLEEIRSNAIKNISALNRIISENDFKNASVIIENSPIGPNSLPVLKRSDIKINEIILFSTIYFGNELVPTKNTYETFDFSEGEELRVPRHTTIEIDGLDYYTLFDMLIDPLNASAEYSYTMYEAEQIPTLVTNYGTVYDLYADLFTIQNLGTSAIYKLNYKSTETTSDQTTCTLRIAETGVEYNMDAIGGNDGTSFVFTFSNTLLIPQGNLTYFFTITHPDGTTEIAQYSTQVIFRKDLSDFTISNVTHPLVFEPDPDPNINLMDSTAYTVYDIPVVLSTYYDNINQQTFEMQVMQQLLISLSFKDYRMLTDFINFKFANTTGSLTNMQLNDLDLLPVSSIISTPPASLEDGQRFIVNNGQGVLEGYEDYIATVATDGTAETWTFIQPQTNQMVYVTDENYKYIFCDSGWVIPIYNIPLQLSIDVFKEETYTGSLGNLAQEIRSLLVETFSSRFGLNSNIYRSEIIDIIHNVDGVSHCRLIRPESNIFFNFNIDEFTQESLLQYTPEYIYFTEDDIQIRIR